MRDREEVVPNTVLYLLARTLAQEAKVCAMCFSPWCVWERVVKGEVVDALCESVREVELLS